MGRLLSAALVVLLASAALPGGILAVESDGTSFPWPPAPWTTGPESGPTEPAAAKVVRRGRPATRAVALTFDDGYNTRACARIGNILRRSGAVGTFFINGQWIKKRPQRWRAILEGMEVANHTRSHPDLTREPHPVIKGQIRTNEWIHEQALGRPMLKVLRPPYGAHGVRVGRIAAQLGYEHIAMWNVDTGDWRPNATAKRIIRRAVDAPPGSIVLMHCARDATARALPAIIGHYQRRGIELAGLSTVLKGARGARTEDVPERYAE